MEPAGTRPGDRWMLRMSAAGLLAVLVFLAGFSLFTQHRVAGLSQRADQANRLSETYQDARYWVGQEESLERKYRLEPGADVLGMHNQAERNFEADLRRLDSIDHSPATRSKVRRLVKLEIAYRDASDRMFLAVDAHRPALVIYYDHRVVDPVFGAIESIVYRQATLASRRALSGSHELRQHQSAATSAIAGALGIGLVLVVVFGSIAVGFRRRLAAAGLAEVRRLAEMAVTDPLTGLRNHRAFHEDIARGLHRVGRTGVPLALVMLDLDGLKDVNDTVGHQAGDARLRALADAIRGVQRAGDTAYRTGGDEFAMLLDGVGSWDALACVNRLQTALADGSDPNPITASAGISAALEFTHKETLIREADLALLAVKRLHQDVAIYTPEMDRAPAQSAGAEDGHHSRTLANALARAVDAKDSYTRSHCQTVSQLCALVADELGFEGEHLSQMRLAGLLHDVGKIGIADAILNKPAALTDDEYRQMQAHSLLGYDIISAAELDTEAGWVLHHHERYDGGGYPDGLAGEQIALESRIILVADAYEAMTSDRPYRRAPGREFAIAELRRHAGTQFDTEVVDALCRVLLRASTDGEDRRSAVAA